MDKKGISRFDPLNAILRKEYAILHKNVFEGGP
jgi:hypothetical protein